MIFISDKKMMLAVAGLVISILYTFYISIHVVSAAVYFTEVMYNPDGTDSGREWVEVYNSGPETVDLSGYKLLENGTNHKISTANNGDSAELLPNNYAIIADDPTKFLVDFSTSGLILDSAFSLKNDGEQIELIDLSGESVDMANYLPEWGANGTGNTLQLNESIWIPAKPTPNAQNETVAADEDSTTTGSDNDTSSGGSSDNDGSTHSSQTDLSDFKPKNDLKISIGRERNVLINTPVEFVLRHSTEEDKDLKKSSIKAFWSFGDGNSSISKGTEVDNIYYNVGEYNVVTTVSYGKNQSVSRTKVHVTEPLLLIKLHNRGKSVDIMLKNDNKTEINVGGFIIEGGDNRFRIPQDTIISPQNSIILSSITTGINHFSNLSLYYPNGFFADKFNINTEYLKLLEVTPEENVSKIVEFINSVVK